MPESSRQHKCLRFSSQEGNKANLFLLLRIKRILFSLLCRTIMGSAQREGGLPRGGLTVASLCNTHIWLGTSHTHMQNSQCRISNALAEVRNKSRWEVALGRCPNFSTSCPNIQNMDAHCCTLSSVCRDPECRRVQDSSMCLERDSSSLWDVIFLSSPGLW